MEIVNTASPARWSPATPRVMVEPAAKGIELILESSVINQYGKQIRKTILETLERLDVKNVKISVIDKGALDCTLKARVECAVFRSCHITEQLPWGGAIR